MPTQRRRGCGVDDSHDRIPVILTPPRLLSWTRWAFATSSATGRQYQTGCDELRRLFFSFFLSFFFSSSGFVYRFSTLPVQSSEVLRCRSKVLRNFHFPKARVSGLKRCCLFKYKLGKEESCLKKSFFLCRVISCSSLSSRCFCHRQVYILLTWLITNNLVCLPVSLTPACFLFYIFISFISLSSIRSFFHSFLWFFFLLCHFHFTFTTLVNTRNY